MRWERKPALQASTGSMAVGLSGQGRVQPERQEVTKEPMKLGCSPLQSSVLPSCMSTASPGPHPDCQVFSVFQTLLNIKEYFERSGSFPYNTGREKQYINTQTVFSLSVIIDKNLHKNNVLKPISKFLIIYKPSNVKVQVVFQGLINLTMSLSRTRQFLVLFSN